MLTVLDNTASLSMKFILSLGMDSNNLLTSEINQFIPLSLCKQWYNVSSPIIGTSPVIGED